MPFFLCINRNGKIMLMMKKTGRLVRRWFSSSVGGGVTLIRELFPGAWQQDTDVKLSREDVLAFHPVFACITLIASDISKLPLRLKKRDSTGIWLDVKKTEPVLIRPNKLQNRHQFFENWLNSKLSTGNAYIFKRRTQSGKVKSLHVLDPGRITPLVSDEGEVFYKLSIDNVAGIKDSVTIPACEMIHDRFNCLYHPLIGVPPIYACAMASAQGRAIMKQSTRLFINGGKPSGVIELPGDISPETLCTLRADWETSYGGKNVGRTAILPEGARYNPSIVSPVDAQAAEQLGLTAEICCSVYHVPLFKIGLGEVPSYNNVEALDQQYYSQCVQTHIEAIETLLAEGLELGEGRRIEFDLNALLRMDTSTRFKAYNDAIKGGWFAPNEARKKENLPPVEGGDTPYAQQQNYSLAALSRRDNNLKPKKYATESAEKKPKALIESEQRTYKSILKGMFSP
ncbi:MAG: phage portal protein [Candidatus Arsenophonus phytopathogenicus]